MLSSRWWCAHTAILQDITGRSTPPDSQAMQEKNDKRRFLSGGVKWRTQKLLLRLLVSHIKTYPKLREPQTGQSAAWNTMPPPVCVSAASLSLSPLCPFAEKSAAHSNIHPLVIDVCTMVHKVREGHASPAPRTGGGEGGTPKKRAEQRRV